MKIVTEAAPSKEEMMEVLTFFATEYDAPIRDVNLFKLYNRIDKDKLYMLIEKYLIVNNIRFKIGGRSFGDFYGMTYAFIFEFESTIDHVIAHTLIFWDITKNRYRQNYEFLRWLKYILENEK